MPLQEVPLKAIQEKNKGFQKNGDIKTTNNAIDIEHSKNSDTTDIPSAEYPKSNRW